MFFSKARKYLAFFYIFYFFAFLIIYFLLYKDYGFQSEVYSLSSVFASYSQVKILIIPLLISLYILECILTVKFLTDFYGKRESFGYYVFYLITSLSGLFFYGLTVVAVYFPLRNVIKQLKAVSLTEMPLIYIYTVLFLVIVFVWKVVTYWKIKARVNYFGKYPGVKFAVLPLNGFKLGSFLKFLFYVSITVGFPFVLFMFGILNGSYFLIMFALIFSLIVFPFNKLFIYYLLAEKSRY